MSNTPGYPGKLLELFFLLEILEIFWKFAKSPGNFLVEFVCVIGVGWGLSPHASSFKLKFTVSITWNSTEFSSEFLLETPGNLL